ncbi:acid phosphatase [Undibacterium sp. TJN25]|uniref:acid phosphatase n=1 Tax=Undibacterium sp. TJN25 TaxID=3413056 RepID=UPI003BF0CD96
MKKIYSLLLTAVCGVSIAFAPLSHAKEGKPFPVSKDFDLIKLLPPPPPVDSAKNKEELAEVLTLQVTRTPEMTARAQADAEESVWRFAGVVGPDFKPEKLPRLNAFFIRVLASEGPQTDPAKEFWKHPRPHQYSDLVKPVVKLSKSYSYPSGHATAGTMVGILLANMLPEKRMEIAQRSADYANNRVIAGIHFRSDIDAGRIAGTLIIANMMTNSEFNAEFEAARKELRGQMGLPLAP